MLLQPSSSLLMSLTTSMSLLLSSLKRLVCYQKSANSYPLTPQQNPPCLKRIWEYEGVNCRIIFLANLGVAVLKLKATLSRKWQKLIISIFKEKTITKSYKVSIQLVKIQMINGLMNWVEHQQLYHLWLGFLSAVCYKSTVLCVLLRFFLYIEKIIIVSHIKIHSLKSWFHCGKSSIHWSQLDVI